MTHYRFISRLFNFKDEGIQIISLWSTFTAFIVSFSNNFLGISVGLFVMLFIIMITDYVTGLASSKLEEKNKAKLEEREVKDVFSSKRGLGWVFKFGSYIVFLYVSLLLSEYIEESHIDFMVWVMKLAHFYILIHIFYWEIKSVDENFEKLGFDFKILKLVGNLFSGIGKIIGGKIKQKEDDN